MRRDDSKGPAPVIPPRATAQLPLVPCRFCGRPILWANLPSGGKVPVDPKATVYVVAQPGVRPEDAAALNVKELMTTIATDQKLAHQHLVGVFVSHFATCTGVDRVKARQARKEHA